MVNMNNRLFLCVILFGLAAGIGFGAAVHFLPDRKPQVSSAAGLYEPEVAADRMRAAQALSVVAGGHGRPVTEYVDEAEKLANSINVHMQPKYRGADRVSIENAALVMVQIESAASSMGETATAAQLAARSRHFIEDSIPH